MEDKVHHPPGYGSGLDVIIQPYDPREHVKIEVIDPPVIEPLQEQEVEASNGLTLRRTVSEYPDLKQDVTECHCECEGCGIVSKFLGL